MQPHKMQTHNFGATYQEGIVSAIDAAKHKVRCKIPALEDLETAWLPFLTPNAGSNQFYCLPDVGELVALLLDSQGEGGCVLGAIYNDQDPTPVTESEIWLHKFSNGTEIGHNRSSGEIWVKTSGVVNVQAGKVNITAPCEITGDVNINGDLTTTGNIQSKATISGASVKQGNTELGTHKHNEQGDGKPTSAPI